MIEIRASFIMCEKCTSAVDINFFGFTSLLGPPLVVCHWCGGIVATGRQEWRELSTRGKLWFFGVSLIYVVIVGLMGAISFDAAAQYMQDREWRESFRFSQPTFWLGLALWAIFVVFLQIFRIFCSRRRTRAEEHKPLERSIRSAQIGMQVKCLLLLVLIPASAWLGRWMWDKFGG